MGAVVTITTQPAQHISMRDWVLAVLDESARRHAEEARKNDSDNQRAFVDGGGFHSGVDLATKPKDVP